MPAKNMKNNPIILGNTAGLPEEIWLQWREHGPYYNAPADSRYLPITLGGSDVSAVFNVSPWKSAYELYHKKIGTETALKKEFNTDAKELGHIYEDAIANVFLYWFQKNYPQYYIEMENDQNMYQCGTTDEDGSLLYPWAVVNLDRRISVNGKKGILEVKSTSDRNIDTIRQWQAGIVPIYYELQCRYYMEVMNLDFCYIICAWGLRLDQVAVCRIDRNTKIGEHIMATCSHFIDCVEQEYEPDPADGDATLINEFYYRLYGAVDESAPAIELPEKYRDMVLDAMELEERISDAQKKVDELDAKREDVYRMFYPVFKTSSYGTFRLDEKSIVSIKLKTPMTRRKFDTERFIKEHPELLKEYGKQMVDEAKLKSEKANIYRDYSIPPQPSLNSDKKNSFTLTVKELRTGGN